MSWSYDVTKLQDGGTGAYPNTTIGVRYQIRLLLQDNQTNRQLMQDEEIDWLQTQEANAYMVAARCCDSLIARFGAVTSKHVGDLGLTFDPKFYKALATTLRSRGMTYQQVYAGGISITDKISQQQDTDKVVPMFFVGFGDNRFAANLAPGDQNSEAINNPNAI